ncbi:uncharacterized protein LOC125656640 [Ostrea edulis]|uniref:uncharacterized protein LOC125656640 n=1 Tax=Ostrea edulis TaxID=37623 RepID=UPI0024AEA927|nr:uncharacterized protein LOC125656640 [Ostrea edulis]
MSVEMYPVESCPGDGDSWQKAGITLNCSKDIIGRNLYQCAPNEDKTDLVEFCLKGSIGRFEEGLCVYAYPSGHLGVKNCTTFVTGCPETSYNNDEIYNYPACLEINREAGCYLADLTCLPTDRTAVTLNRNSVSYKDGLGNVTLATTNFTNPKTSNPQDSVNVTTAVVSSLLATIVVIGIILFFWCRRRMRRTPEHIDDMIGFLPDNQKAFLYSLLCYDDNKMSWSDSELWLKTLDTIRKELFDAKNVLIAHIYHDIDELMKKNLIQNNDQYLEIVSKNYAEDTMYQLQNSTRSKFPNDSYMLTLLCMTKVGEYCRPGYRESKHVYCGDGLYPSLVYRLQMDILIYQTIEHEDVQRTASWILNISTEKLKSETARERIYNDLLRDKEKGDTKKLGAASWTRMTREGKGFKGPETVYELIPQCARSTIGQHDHNDIFMMAGKMYAVKDDLPTFNGKFEDLFVILLSDKFRVPFDERYIFDGITEKSGDAVRFISDEIRRHVMYSYVVRKLLTDDDMENFIKVASVDCLVEYGRLWRYTKEETTEPCLFIPEDMENLYLEKLGYAATKHALFDDELLKNTTWKKISEINDIPFDLCIQSKNFRNRFVEYVRNERGELGGEVQSLKYMYSAFLFHNMDMSEENINSIRNSDISTWPVLLGILMSDGYKIKNDIATTPMVKGRFLNISADQYNKALEEIKSKRNIVEINEEHVTFASPGIKHAVMCSFVESCLKSDEDLESYIEESSTDSLMEYYRLWSYKRDEKEACLFIPEKFREKYIKRLNQNVIIHVMVENRADSDGKRRTTKTRKYISELLNIPLEVLSWDIGGRRRYLETIKMGKKKMYRARGMLVGCTGAGKTTLLQRLQSRHTTQTTETTKGLEIHENLFEIVSDTLKDHQKKSAGLHSDKQLLSMTDFAGQAAYYACHQVYLSRRAFYLLVVDMSKKLTKEAHKDNKDRHNPIGSLFHHWTYKDYFTFWLQCIQTYCEDGDRPNVGHDTDTVDRRNVGKNNDTVDRRNPVILIASHKDKAKPKKNATKLAFFEKLKSCILQQALKNLLSPDKYYEIECPQGWLTKKREEMIEEVKKCVVKTVQKMPHWGEEIPLSWVDFEDTLKQKKAERVWKTSTLQDMGKLQSMKELEIGDMLRFFHEIGQIIYFPDEKLRDVIIIDVQWFVDGFKNIIADENHLAREIKDCDEKIERGIIAVSTLENIWEKAEDESYKKHMHEIVPYMEKLGLMVEIKTSKEFYLPSMNRIDTFPVDLKTINDGQKTSILIFHFKTYLPHFFFFRLVVHCFKEWDALKEDMFSKNAAFYKERDHSIAIAVNKTSIQLQVFTESKQMDLQTNCVIEIREKVERIIRELTETFHKQVTYGIGYSCKDIKITDEDKDYFLVEDDILQMGRGIPDRICPRHPKAGEKHKIKIDNLLQFWNTTGGT